MPSNVINAQGITIQDLADILNEILVGSPSVPGMLTIYGSDINVDSNSPDGQMINILALSKQDVLNLIVQDYNSKDPDQAVGTALDAVSQLCGATRKGGTYTQVQVVVTASGSITLAGQDTSNPYTVSDGNGNQVQLVASTNLSPGNNTLLFQAVNIGAVQFSPNTITNPVTIISGVTAINNPNAPIVIGVNQESDAQFRIRRQKSTNMPAQGYFSSLMAGLLNLSGVASAVIFENPSDTTDGDSIPSHSIWVVVDGGNADAIAKLIYNYRNAGCGMKGATVVPVLQADGTLFSVKFDIATIQNLYVRFHLDSINGAVIDNNAVSTALIENYILSLNQPADVTDISNLISQSNPNLVISQIAVSGDNVAWGNVVFPSPKSGKFVLTVPNIIFL